MENNDLLSERINLDDLERIRSENSVYKKYF